MRQYFGDTVIVLSLMLCGGGDEALRRGVVVDVALINNGARLTSVSGCTMYHLPHISPAPTLSQHTQFSTVISIFCTTSVVQNMELILEIVVGLYWHSWPVFNRQACVVCRTDTAGIPPERN